jgi:hypothetical protein
MAALTYAFTQLGPHPLDDAYATESPAPRRELAPPSPPTNPPAVVPEPLAETAPSEPVPVTPEVPAPSEAPTVPMPQVAAVQGPRPVHSTRREQDEAPSERAVEATSTPFAFPEFTDSAPKPTRERASAGPRLDSLFERSEASAAPDSDLAPPASTAERARRASGGLPSCEAAVARNEEHLEIGGPRGPADVTREAYASVLQNGSYLGGCSVPDRTVLELCVAVKGGRAVGVTVTSAPASAELTACVRRAVSQLAFPSSERLDVTHTRFDAARR